ncbi:site-specific DNA-methyltransferase [Helicobacter pylori]|uniref:site-specific DNA-methyltransferase n=1 Tax=Helicobacter pylori TaxID=210 RepID=UPI001FD204C1|nr:site-specific DNA-methyltransferase [Helicobacter pylori]UOS31380.1 site-specific DNA-methyltransferase [Helicobacter pylori]
MQNKEICGEKSVNEKNLEVFNRYFPGCLSIENDGKLTLDAGRLKALLGDFSEIKEEGYGLDFVGKKIALNQAFKKNNKILKPLNESTSKHILIKGDNLDALKILKQSYSEKIKMIYIDPPYNTKNDNFIYSDDFSQSNEEILKTLDYSKEKLDYIKNLFGSKCHSGWLSFMYPRLLLAKDLLKQDGVIFISIDDNEAAQLKLLCDEIFGEGNFLSSLTWLKGNAQNDAQYFQNNYENILVYAKHVETLSLNRMALKKEVKVFCENDKFYYEGSGFVSGNANSDLNHHALCGYTIYYNSTTMDLQIFMDYDIEKAKTSNNEKEVYRPFNQNLINQGYIAIRPPKKEKLLGRWVVSFEKFQNLISENKILIKQNRNNFSISRKEWLDAKQVKQNENGEFYAILDKSSPARNVIENIGGGNGTKEVNDLFNQKIFNNPKPLKLISRLIELSTNEGDIILDFFAGSGTTAHAVLESNKSNYQKLSEGGGGLFNGLNAAFKERHFILVQLDEKIDPKKNKSAHDFCLNTLKSPSPSIFDITEERIKRAGAKIKEACAYLDVGFRAFEIIDDETNDKNLNEANQKDLFAYSNPKKRETQTILIKLLCLESLELTTPISCLVENALYLALNTAFIVGDIEMSEVLENLKDKGVEKISVYMPAISNDRLCLELGSNLLDLKLESGDLKIRG